MPLKKGLERYNVETVDIGIPKRAFTYIGPGDLVGLRSRGDFTDKGDGGRVLVIGGGPYTGAPAFAAMAAYRSGAEIVSVAAPRRAANIIASFSPDLIVWPTTDEEKIVENDIEMLKPLIQRHHTVVIGMGMGHDPETVSAISKILPLCDRVVIDADALQPGMPLHGIITPNVKEFGVGRPGQAAQRASAREVKSFAAKKFRDNMERQPGGG